jgi:hypothetical protein
LGKELRQHDLGYLTLGTDSGPGALAIPPRTDQFRVDSYCSSTATKVSRFSFSAYYNGFRILQLFPVSGITVLASFPHTHLQGRMNISINTMNSLFIEKVIVYGQKSFEITQQLVIYLMLKHIVSIINLKIFYHNQFNCIQYDFHSLYSFLYDHQSL